MSKVSKFFSVLKQFAPIILALTPLAPIAPAVAEAIATAETIPGASGSEKLAAAKAIVVDAAQAVNAQAGHDKVNVAEVEASADSVISGVVDSVNHIKAIAVKQAA